MRLEKMTNAVQNRSSFPNMSSGRASPVAKETNGIHPGTHKQQINSSVPRANLVVGIDFGTT
jgi:hypothetical protein